MPTFQHKRKSISSSELPCASVCQCNVAAHDGVTECVVVLLARRHTSSIQVRQPASICARFCATPRPTTRKVRRCTGLRTGQRTVHVFLRVSGLGTWRKLKLIAAIVGHHEWRGMQCFQGAYASMSHASARHQAGPALARHKREAAAFCLTCSHRARATPRVRWCSRCRCSQSARRRH